MGWGGWGIIKKYMSTKKIKCPTCENFFDSSSFLNVLHQYINSKNKEELDEIRVNIIKNRLQELQFFSQGLSLFLREHSENLIINAHNTDNWDFEIDKWNWFGIILAHYLKADKYAEIIYRALYSLLCELQAKCGRIHKGLPLHQIGWIYLLRGNQESLEKSQFYIKLAMIEDIVANPKGYKSLPAYSVLKGEHNISDYCLDELAKSVENYKKKDNHLFRPELIYLNYVINPNNHERTSFYELDSHLANNLFDECFDDDNQRKGTGLEMLFAYVFLASPGFEVLRDVKSLDSQHDLLIRNLHTGDPIVDELGKYVLIECRNKASKVSAKEIRDFAAKVIQTSCNSGIIITKKGITGAISKKSMSAGRLAISKIYQRHNVAIIPITIEQLKQVLDKKISLIDLLVSEYEKIRFEMTSTKKIDT